MPITTLPAIKSWLAVTTGTDDPLLTALQTAAESAVLQFLDRDTLDLHSFNVKLDGNDKDTVTLRDFPIVSLTSVVINGLTLSPGTYEAYGSSNDQTRKVFLLAASQAYTGPVSNVFMTFPKGRRNIQISGTAGYADGQKPAGIVQAVNDTVGQMYRGRTRIGERSKALAGETTTYVTALLSDTAKAILQPYRNLIPA